MKFRNLNVLPEAPSRNGGFEGLLAAVERGGRVEWHRIAQALLADPRGKVASEMSEVVDVVEHQCLAELFRRIQREALARSEAGERRPFRPLTEPGRG